MKREQFKFRDFISLINRTKPRYWQLYLGLALGMVSTGAQLVVPKFTKDLINGFAHHFNVQLMIMVIVLFIVSAVISAISGSVLGIFGEHVVAGLRRSLWDKLVRLPVSYFDEVKTGEITSRLVNDSSQIKDLLAVSFPRMVTSILQLVGALVIMLFMDWHMTIVMFVAVPLVMVVMLPIMRATGKIGRQRQDKLAKFNGTTESTLSEIRLVKSSNGEKYETKTGFGEIQDLYKIGLKEAIYDSISGPVMTMVMMAMFVGILSYGALRVINGEITMGTLLSLLMYLFQITGPVVSLGQFFSDLSKTNGSTMRVRELLSQPEEALDLGHDIDTEGKDLAMNDVSFAYSDDAQVLHHVNFEAKPNTVTAFAGPSGGGKSTIFSLIERYYTPAKGQVTIGGQDISGVNLTDWRSQIGLVSQDSAIMSGTVRHNLTYGLEGEYSDEELWNVLQMAYAEDFVREMPQQLDTEVGERGVKVSGGQRQRIAIARAFLRDPKILMLDEATASLDSESEAMIQKALTKLMKDRTTLIIAHRLSTIVDANQIYFIENGTVTGHGNHQELLDSHPVYKEYVENQFKL
nr:ABC transporter ATP-binding protein [Pediococcus argentinicus]